MKLNKIFIKLNFIKNVQTVYYSSSFLSNALELFLNYVGKKMALLKEIYKVFSNINTLNSLD